MYVWETGSGRMVRHLGGGDVAATALDVSADGEYLGVGCADGTIRIYGTRGYHEVGQVVACGAGEPVEAPLGPHTDSLSSDVPELMHMVRSVTFRPNRREFWAHTGYVSVGRALRAWSIEGDQVREKARGPTYRMCCLTFFPDGGLWSLGWKTARCGSGIAERHKKNGVWLYMKRLLWFVLACRRMAA
jgi:WD40 repeat protein